MARRAPSLLAVHLAFVAFGATCSVAAQPAAQTGAALSWVRGPGAEACASLADVTAAVNTRLRRSAFVSALDAKRLIEATITIDRENKAFRVHIVLNGEAREPLGTRDLEVPGEDCRAATSTAALAIALMVDPNAALAGQEPPPVVAPPPDGASAPSAPSSPPPALALPPRPCPVCSAPVREQVSEHWHTRLGVGALGSLGQIPGIAWGVLGSVRLSPVARHVGVELLGRYLAEKNAEARPGAGGELSASSVALGGFWVPLRPPRLALSFDAAAELGTLAASGYAFNASNHYNRAWIANLDLGTELALRLAGRAALTLRLGLALPLVRHEFSALIGSRPVKIFNTSAAIGDVALGVAFDP